MQQRELKFRIYSFIDKSFIYFDIYEGYPSGIYGGVSPPEQFTGLKDINKKEIYEGDILKFRQCLFNIPPEEYPVKIKKVEFDDLIGAWNVYETAAGELNIEVIGNFIENFELLK